VLAQGQQNAARTDLTFIEKANFARQMRDAGYDRKVICDALAMDKTLISRLLSVGYRVPLRLVEAIASAPGVGRDRWLVLADKAGDGDLVNHAQGESSDARFEAVMQVLRPPKRPPPQPTQDHDSRRHADGRSCAQRRQDGAGHEEQDIGRL